MKKSLKIFLIVIVIIVAIILLGIVWWKDNNKVIEKPSDKVIEIAKSITGEDYEVGLYAYSIQRDTDKIITTYYSIGEAPRVIITHYIENKVATKIYKEVHYETKLLAKWHYFDDYMEVTDKKVKGNVLMGWIEAFGLGKTDDEIYNSLISDTNLVRIYEE